MMLDGTFKYVPDKFVQLCTVHVDVNCHVSEVRNIYDDHKNCNETITLHLALECALIWFIRKSYNNAGCTLCHRPQLWRMRL